MKWREDLSAGVAYIAKKPHACATSSQLGRIMSWKTVAMVQLSNTECFRMQQEETKDRR